MASMNSNSLSSHLAISVHDLSFSYSSLSNKPVTVLDQINLSVPNGSIYGLLGSSGCGKTTLLRCILGRLKPLSGQCYIHGVETRSKESGIPGPLVGYMPQEISLFPGFTIEETLLYFSHLYGMKRRRAVEEIDVLINLLNLPSKRNKVERLSGGQKRRVSLIIALLHSPRILILDEPTVGVDPILRRTIWKHLFRLCTQGITIILTTHYIEEARTAGRVGFMRNGKMMADENPEVIMKRFGSSSLEDVFVMLAERQNNKIHGIPDGAEIGQDEPEAGSSFSNAQEDENEEEEEKLIQSTERNNETISFLKRSKSKSSLRSFSRNQKFDSSKYLYFSQLKGLIIKNFRRQTKSWFILVFYFCVPLFQAYLLLMAVGKGPRNLTVSVFNQEEEKTNNLISNLNQSIENDSIDSFYGEKIIQSLINESIIINRFNSLEETLEEVKQGRSSAALVIEKEFTLAIKEGRMQFNNAFDEKIINGSSIRIHLDLTNQFNGLYLKEVFFNALSSFGESIATEEGFSARSFTPPIEFEEPIYGNQEIDLRDYLLPGGYIIVTFYATSIVTCNLILSEKHEGLLERALIAGVSSFQILVSHSIIQIAVFIIQLFLLLPTSYLFGIEIHGSLILVASLCFFQGITGLMFGFLISSISNDIIYGGFSIVGTMFMNVVLSGAFYPLENMPLWIQQWTNVLPLTLPVKAMRSIIFRGWDFNQRQVYLGFSVSITYFCVFLLFTTILLRRSL